MAMLPIRRALISVTDKTHLQDFGRALITCCPGIEILATGNTRKCLEEAGIRTVAIEDYTGFPECFEGRLKTLHPKVEGGILFRRGKDEETAAALDIPPIDMVICNLYNFAKAQAAGLENDALIEQVDIGGPTLVRSAAKNYRSVAVVTDPKDYPALTEELESQQGSLDLARREKLAAKAFSMTADYDSLISRELSRRFLGQEILRPRLLHGKKLRYGENPDQEAWVYELDGEEGIAQAKILSGKELSYNNYEDATMAYNCAVELFTMGCPYGVAIIKHGSPCGLATGDTLEKAFERAWAGDSKSAFGSVVGFSCEVDGSLISLLQGRFVEVLLAPGFSNDFIEWAKAKKPNLRLLQVPSLSKAKKLYRSIAGGILVQSAKQGQPASESFFQLWNPEEGQTAGVATEKAPCKKQEGLFRFALAAVRFAKSNAIVIAREVENGQYQILGVGAGQPNRVDSLQRLALPRAMENLQAENQEKENYDVKEDLKDCVLASDGFFPFPDSVEAAAEAGIQWILQPGGGKNDHVVAEAATEKGLCMIMTGERYFAH